MYGFWTYLQTHFYQLILVIPFIIGILFDSKLDDNFSLFRRDFKLQDPDKQIPYLICYIFLGCWTILIYNLFEGTKQLGTNLSFWASFLFLVIHSLFFIFLSTKQKNEDV
jgi:hypothetical protein